MSLSREQPRIRRPNNNALFSLVPLSDKAEAAVRDENNRHLVSLSLKDNVLSFDIGFHINSHDSTNTLVTLGRDENSDIYLKPNSIARRQCSFEIDDLNTGIVMLYDRSQKQNTRVSSEGERRPFEKGRSPRRVLVYPELNDIISMGGIHDNLIKFRLEWILNEDRIREIVRKHRDARKDSIINPRKARTRDLTETVLPSAIMTPMTPDQAFQGPSDSMLRYFKQHLLGIGSFGKVWRTIDVDSGQVMAMKQVDWVPGSQKRAFVNRVHREVELMRRAKHENITELITSHGWENGSSSIKIFMGLEEGNLDDLSDPTDNKFKIPSGRPARCLQHILSALDFLAYKGIVHRDVKPDNILYSRSLEGPGYHFRLGDFGVGKLAKYAYSCQGTHWYMAPEILKLRDRSNANNAIKERQSPKVDIWSLFVTMAYALNVCNYRERSKNTNVEILEAAKEACAHRWMSRYKAMASEDPDDRASALDILDQHFEGVGIYDRNIDIEMSDINDDIFIDPQLLQDIQDARTPQKCRLSERARHPIRMNPYRIEKKTTSTYTRTRLNLTC